MARCVATKPDGERCRSTTGIGEDGRCLWHTTDPDRREKAQAARRRGGRRGGGSNRQERIHPDDVPPAPKSLADAHRFAAWATAAVAAGRIDDTTAGKISSLLSTFVRAFEKAETASEIDDLRDELRALKAGRS